MLIFLGGTCGNNDWREKLIIDLQDEDYDTGYLFNPVLPPGAWNAEAQAKEDAAKATATYNVFYIADPKQEGNNFSTYSLHEAELSLFENPCTIVIFDKDGLTGHTLKATDKIIADLYKRFPTKIVLAENMLEWFKMVLPKVADGRVI